MNRRGFLGRLAAIVAGVELARAAGPLELPAIPAAPATRRVLLLLDARMNLVLGENCDDDQTIVGYFDVGGDCSDLTLGNPNIDYLAEKWVNHDVHLNLMQSMPGLFRIRP